MFLSTDPAGERQELRSGADDSADSVHACFERSECSRQASPGERHDESRRDDRCDGQGADCRLLGDESATFAR